MDITFPHAGTGREFRLRVPDEPSFERLRDALGDPVWLVGATYQILTTNEFKRGRFEDAFGAWLDRQDPASVATGLRAADVDARVGDVGAGAIDAGAGVKGRRT